MSVGIGTGTFHFFMTGSVHRELLIAGPAMTETLAMEAIADAGEIGISPTLAALPRPGLHRARRRTAIRSSPRRPRSSASARRTSATSATLDIASCIPVAARAHVLLAQERARAPDDHGRLHRHDGHRPAARGARARGARPTALDERMRAIQEAALRYEVPFYETDVGKSSVKALLTAGAPSSTGHDEERMLRTLREIMEQPGLVPMRIGVNTGKVFTGDFGPPYRRAYRVFGDAINTAARVMSKAEAGQILSTEIVLEPVADDLRDDADRAVRGQGQGRAGPRVDRRAGHRRQGGAPRRRRR